MLTHISAEWAMDAHIHHALLYRPYHLLISHRPALKGFVAKQFNVTELKANRAIKHLAWADRTLRFSRLSSFCLSQIAARDDEFVIKLDYYLQQTHDVILEFESVLRGKQPALYAELLHMNTLEMAQWRAKCLRDARLRLSSVVQIYNNYQEQCTTPHI
jgi:hypothetical protein